MVNEFKRFKDVRPIFKGGQKDVYSGYHIDYGNVAIKVGKFKNNPQLERIKREVGFLKSIKSIYFPKNYEFKVNEREKEFFIVEEFIKSKKISELLDYYNSEFKIVELLTKLINALKILWDKNIVHRDLKPDNILINDDFEPIIIDLGIARFIDYESLTKTIAYFGPCTPIYASPEQLLNKKGLINMRTDFFALGIILLEIYLGFHPFNPEKVGNDKSIPENIVLGLYVDPKKKANTSDTFANLIHRLLKVEPYLRFRNYVILKDYLIKHWEIK
jgi:serine/threonine-protein kinase